LFYKFVRGILAFWVYLTGIKIIGRENMPKSGPVVTLSNHSHWSDPILMGVAWQRPVRFIGKAELEKKVFLNKIAQWVNLVPIHRGETDLNAMRLAIDAAKNDGSVLGVFPEGTRNKGKDLLEFKEGAIFIAYKSESTICPMALKNSSNFLAFWRPRPKVIVGKPIFLEKGDMNTQKFLERYNDICRSEVLELLEDK